LIDSINGIRYTVKYKNFDPQDDLNKVTKAGKMKVLITVLILILASGALLFAQEEAPVFQAADQSLLVLPTAYTMPKGRHTFTNYEIFIVQYAYGLTDRTHLSIGMPFPIFVEAFEYSALGIKQNYLRYEKFQAAATLTWLPKAEGLGLMNVISYGSPQASAHAYVGMVMSYEEIKNGAFLALGGMVSVSQRIALISELMTVSAVLDEEGGQLLTLGVRFKGDKLSWDLGGFRPFTGDTGDLLLFPLVKMTVMF